MTNPTNSVTNAMKKLHSIKKTMKENTEHKIGDHVSYNGRTYRIINIAGDFAMLEDQKGVTFKAPLAKISVNYRTRNEPKKGSDSDVLNELDLDAKRAEGEWRGSAGGSTRKPAGGNHCLKKGATYISCHGTEDLAMKAWQGLSNKMGVKIFKESANSSQLMIIEGVDYEDEELYSGCYVRDVISDGENGEIFRMVGDSEDRRVRIEDKDGRGWFISPDRLTKVSDSDPAINRYFPNTIDDDDSDDDFLNEAESKNYHAVFVKVGGKWTHVVNADNKEDADDEVRSCRNNGEKCVRLVVPKSEANWSEKDVDQYVTNRIAKKAKKLDEYGTTPQPAAPTNTQQSQPKGTMTTATNKKITANKVQTTNTTNADPDADNAKALDKIGNALKDPKFLDSSDGKKLADVLGKIK